MRHLLKYAAPFGVPGTTPGIPQPPAPDGSDTFILAGQSNASGRGDDGSGTMASPETVLVANSVEMLGNDDIWKEAYEPTDDYTNQVDTVSADDNARHSYGVRFGNDLYAARGGKVYLVPAARGSSPLIMGQNAAAFWWNRTGGVYDRATLQGNALYRAKLAKDISRPVVAVLWHQGEAQIFSGRDSYITDQRLVVGEMRTELGLVPWFAVQLCDDLKNTTRHGNMQVVREQQRQLETGAVQSTVQLPNYFLIPTHDLGLRDIVHLDEESQKILGSRFALAVQEHLYGDAVNGTGPRLTGISKETFNKVKVAMTRTIKDHADYDDYFVVQDAGVYYTQSGRTHHLDSGQSVSTTPFNSISRDPADDHSLIIHVPTNLTTELTVEYSPPYGRVLANGTTVLQGERYSSVVQDADGLPLPCFGPLGLF